MPKFNLLKIVDFLLKPTIILLVFSMYCFVVELFLALLIPISFFIKLNIPDDVIISIADTYFPLFGKIFEILFPIFLILYLIFVLYLFIKNGNYLYKYLLSLKIALIPFWIIAAILMIPIILGSAFPSYFIMPVFGIFLLPLFLIGGFFTVFSIVFIFTSFLNILFLINLLRKNMINKILFIINLVMHLCPFLDIVSIIYLKIRYEGIINNEDKFKIKKSTTPP